MRHVLKSLPEVFEHVLSGAKSFEWRRDDRCPRFEVNDDLELHEYSPEEGRHTGRVIEAGIGYVMRTGFGLPDGFAILGLTGARLRLDQLAEDRKLVARLADVESGLTEWEVAFVESLSAWVSEPLGKPLTDKQRERALQIDER